MEWKLYFWVLRRTNTVKVIIWRLSRLTDVGRPQVPVSALFQTRAGT